MSYHSYVIVKAKIGCHFVANHSTWVVTHLAQNVFSPTWWTIRPRMIWLTPTHSDGWFGPLS